MDFLAQVPSLHYWVDDHIRHPTGWSLCLLFWDLRLYPNLQLVYSRHVSQLTVLLWVPL